MQLLDGKLTSQAVLQELTEAVDQLKKDGKKVPHLAAILVGHDGASEAYVGSKVRACEKVGFESSLIRHPEDITEAELLEEVDRLNKSESVDGFIVQLPLPKHIDENKVVMAIDPKKDVDGFHPVNVGRLALGLPTFISATPYGIVQLLERYQVPTEGKHCVVVGRSNIVGSPMSILMRRSGYPGNCTVTVTHSRTQDLPSYTRSADILIAALGRPNFVTADMVKEGAVVIDVGITRVDDATRAKGYKLVGDVDFENVAPKCSFITPVPGGVGRMTVASLMMNTLAAANGSIYP